MSRRMDREGINMMELQGIKNRRQWSDPRCVEDERGWVQPFSTWQGWEEFNRAAYALRCVMLFRKVSRAIPASIIMDNGRVNRAELHRFSNEARIESDMRTFHFSLARSRKCDRPVLPA